jgi:hypothetical protein
MAQQSSASFKTSVFLFFSPTQIGCLEETDLLENTSSRSSYQIKKARERGRRRDGRRKSKSCPRFCFSVSRFTMTKRRRCSVPPSPCCTAIPHKSTIDFIMIQLDHLLDSQTARKSESRRTRTSAVARRLPRRTIVLGLLQIAL